MRKRSIYSVVVGALLAGLVLVVGPVAQGQTGGAVEVNCPDPTAPGCGGGATSGSTGGGAESAAPTPEPPKATGPKTPRPPTNPNPDPNPNPGGGNQPPEPPAPDKGGKDPGGKDQGGKDRGNKNKGRSGKNRGNSRPPREGRPRSRPRSTGAAPRRSSTPPTRTPGGAPTPSNPGFFDASPGGGNDPLTGVPNFTIRHFKIPLFLMPIYQAAGTEYGIRWEYLAAINEIETNYGRNLNVSSAGALGWMQFMPATWKDYGVDANKDGRKDPYNPADAIFAAARYLKAAGAPKDMRKAIFAYNHAGWYVDSVVLRTRLIAGMSPDLVGSLTGLAEARFPVRGDAKYADDVSERQLGKRVKPGQNAARVISDDPNRKNIRIFAKKGSPVIAVNDGVVKKIGQSEKLGRYLVLEDNFGNSFTYSNLGSISAKYPVPKEDVRKQAQDAASNVANLDARDARPTAPASAGRQRDGAASNGLGAALGSGGASAPAGGSAPAPSADAPGSRFAEPEVVKERLFAHPDRPNALAAGGADQLAALEGDPLAASGPGGLGGYLLNTRGFDPDDFRLVPLRKGARVMGDTILGRLGAKEGGLDPNLSFEVRPAGKNAPAIDPKPLLDGWKLLEATAIYRASGKNVLRGGSSVGQILMMPKDLLQKRVLADDRIEIYECGRKDVRSGQVSRQVLATLAYLAEVGLEPTVTSLKCGHSFYTTSGNVSDHSSGGAVDVARWNGQPVLGHQQKGGLTYQAIKRLMLLQGTMKPTQLISLFEMGGPTLRMGDHADHLHVGFGSAGGSGRGGIAASVLKRGDWFKLVDRLGDIDNPAVSRRPSKYSLPARGGGRGSGAHRGE